MAKIADPARANRRPGILSLLAILALGLMVRLVTWPRVFDGGKVWIDGPDGYYHLRRAWLTLQDWPWTPQFDMLIGVPEGGRISWPPVFDLLLATLALPWKGGSTMPVETLGALLPPLLGLVELLVLFYLVRRLFGRAAALWSAFFAAVLPGVARYSLVGALDHDPLVETIALLGLLGIAGAMARDRVDWRDAALVALAGTLLVLTWAGSPIHLALWCLVVACVAVARLPGATEDESDPAFVLGLGSLLSALFTLPFVLASVWTQTMGATFIGLSWLHTSVLLAAALGGFALSLGLRWRSGRPKWRRSGVLAAVALAGLLPLAPRVWPAVEQGLAFFGRKEDFLSSVTESRPLLTLLGAADLRAVLVRLSLLPLAALVLVPWTLRKTRGDRRVVLVSVWFGYLFALALIQARYAHAAALPAVVLGGLWASDGLSLWPRRRRAVAVAVTVAVLATSLPAYLPVPGFREFSFLGRPSMLRSTSMDEVCDFFRDRVPAAESWTDPLVPSSSSVLAEWSFGHWLIWRGRQGTVGTPLGPQGQTAFADGLRYFYADEEEAREIFRRRRVRYVVALAEVPELDTWAGLAGVDAGRFLDAGRILRADSYLPTVAARLSWIHSDEIELFGRRYPKLDGIREVFRSRRSRRNPFGRLPGVPEDVPLARVYEIESP